MKSKKAAKKIAKKKTSVKKAIKTTQVKNKVIAAETEISPRETHYLLILDESGSMNPVRQVTLDGLNEQIQTIKNLDKQYSDQDYFVNIIKFDDNVKPLFENIPAQSTRTLVLDDYKPDTMTALFEAIGVSVTKIKNNLSEKLKSNEASVVVVILTDGANNIFKEYNAEKVKSLITELEKTGLWTFTFIGANQDAVLTANSLGVNAANAVNYTHSVSGATLAFSAVGSAMSKRAAYINSDLYSMTTASFMSNVTGGLNNLGEDANSLNLSHTVSQEDLNKAADLLKSKKDKNKK